uniref:Uncharacterized protein LOC113799232 n=1 Tax=Dermatophagoides pteronyssinus TaxID=6956 RepID=A0A6P6YK51_DERPT|nr:uncharacterized protein LOC113799232 [Dermatophagoides pteronyssinus]
MWWEALPACGAMLASLSLLEISPFVFHYLSWGCPMMRESNGHISRMLLRRDQRIAEDFGIRWDAKHMYTYSFGSLTDQVKTEGNYSHYLNAEQQMLQKQQQQK